MVDRTPLCMNKPQGTPNSSQPHQPRPPQTRTRTFVVDRGRTYLYWAGLPSMCASLDRLPAYLNNSPPGPSMCVCIFLHFCIQTDQEAWDTTTFALQFASLPSPTPSLCSCLFAFLATFPFILHSLPVVPQILLPSPFYLPIADRFWDPGGRQYIAAHTFATFPTHPHTLPVDRTDGPPPQ